MKNEDYSNKITTTEYNLLGRILLEAAAEWFAEPKHQEEYQKSREAKRA